MRKSFKKQYQIHYHFKFDISEISQLDTLRVKLLKEKGGSLLGRKQFMQEALQHYLQKK